MSCDSADSYWGRKINDEILIHYLPGMFALESHDLHRKPFKFLLILRKGSH